MADVKTKIQTAQMIAARDEVVQMDNSMTTKTKLIDILEEERDELLSQMNDRLDQFGDDGVESYLFDRADFNGFGWDYRCADYWRGDRAVIVSKYLEDDGLMALFEFVQHALQDSPGECLRDIEPIGFGDYDGIPEWITAVYMDRKGNKTRVILSVVTGSFTEAEEFFGRKLRKSFITEAQYLRLRKNDGSLG